MGFGHHQWRPGPAVSSNMPKPPEGGHLGGFNRVEARREPAEGSDHDHPKDGVYETTAAAAKAEPAKDALDP